MSAINLILRPLDLLFCRDGRPFTAATRAQTGMPQPQTVAAAIRSALLKQQGCDFKKLASLVQGGATTRQSLKDSCPDAPWIADLGFQGPLFAKESGNAWEPLFQAPANLLREKKNPDKLCRLVPLSFIPPGWVPPEPDMAPLWTAPGVPAESVSGFVSGTGLSAYLKGENPAPSHLLKPGDVYSLDERVGLGVSSETNTGEDGMLFSVRYLALKSDCALFMRVLLPDGIQVGDVQSEIDRLKIVALGGEGRRVAMETNARVVLPEEADKNEARLLYLATPGFFQKPSWRPEELAGKLTAAAVGGAEAVSGWDLARGGAKPTRFACRAGSVYMLKEPWDQSGSSFGAKDDTSLGWGWYLKGKGTTI